MEIRRDVAFVGQGPNRAAWEHGVKAGMHLAPADPHAFAERYCRRISLTGAVGTKLGALLGLERSDFLRKFPLRFNLNARFGGKKGKGDAFDRAEGKASAERLLADASIQAFVLVGAEVARAFGVKLRADPLQWEVRGEGLGRRYFLVIPHPSGVNLWWNDLRNRERATAAVRIFLGPRSST